MSNRIRIFANIAWHILKLFPLSFQSFLAKDKFGMSWWEAKRLEYSPGFMNAHTRLLGKKVELTVPFWYLFSYREIFKEEIYRFTTDSPAPLIIDCGSYIGLSIIYFKYLYPQSSIIGFEPDPANFAVLQKNMKSFGFADVQVLQEAIWNSETEIDFYPGNSVGGSATNNTAGGAPIRVRTRRLRELLDRHVVFLKIDIEGSESQVLQDCCDRLGNVDHLFVEYHGRRDQHQTTHEMLKIIQDSGFRYHIKEAYPIPHPFVAKERQRYYDLQLNIFAFRNE